MDLIGIDHPHVTRPLLTDEPCEGGPGAGQIVSSAHELNTSPIRTRSKSAVCSQAAVRGDVQRLEWGRKRSLVSSSQRASSALS
jgi:hypothetical protein